MSWSNLPPGGPPQGGPPAGYNPQPGAPPAFNPGYGNPSGQGQPLAGYGNPGGAPSHGQPPAGYAPPRQAGHTGGGYAPPPQSQGYGAPPPQSQGYGAPPPQSQGYGAPPPQGQGYGAPPPQGQGYGAPPRQAYGAPPPQGHGYGAPPPSGYAPPTGGFGPAPPPGVSQDLWQWFQSVDADKSNKITATELQQALMNGNWTPFNAETCRLMIGMFDKDRNGTIDVHEFAALWKYIQDWKSCFDRFDTDRSGNISTMELQNAFKSFGYNLSPNFCSLCVRVFNRQSTTSMNFDDFIQCCVMLKSLTDQFRAKDTQQQGTVRIHYEEFLRMALDNSVL